MGIDLTLLPVEGTEQCAFAHSILETGGNYELHDALRAMDPEPRPSIDFASYVARVPDGTMKGEHCYGRITDDCYGQPLTFLSAGKVIRAFEKVRKDYLSRRQLAALAYLRELPSDTSIALFWH